jgi:hypothetical protein
MHDEKADPVVSHMLEDRPAVGVESIRSCLDRQVRAIQAVDASSVPAKHLCDNDLVGDPLILREKPPRTL